MIRIHWKNLLPPVWQFHKCPTRRLTGKVCSAGKVNLCTMVLWGIEPERVFICFLWQVAKLIPIFPVKVKLPMELSLSLILMVVFYILIVAILIRGSLSGTLVPSNIQSYQECLPVGNCNSSILNKSLKNLLRNKKLFLRIFLFLQTTKSQN